MSTTFYTADHEWLTIEGDIITLGITDYAQQALGEIVFIELPEIGQACQTGEAISVVESVKSASDIYSPVNGEVVEVNSELDSNPELVNESPEGQAWFMRIRVSEAVATDNYMNHDDYLNSLDNE